MGWSDGKKKGFKKTQDFRVLREKMGIFLDLPEIWDFCGFRNGNGPKPLVVGWGRRDQPKRIPRFYRDGGW